MWLSHLLWHGRIRDRLSFSSSLLSLPYAICMLLGLGEFFIEVFPLGNIGYVHSNVFIFTPSL